MDERFYCVICKVPVEYIPELDEYSCGRCEQIFEKDELVPASFIERIVLKDVVDRVFGED